MRAHDSRRYHRVRGPRAGRAFNFGTSSSEGQVVSPFGNLPYGLAGLARRGFAGPLAKGFGFGGGQGSPYARGQGPTGTFITQATPTLAQYIPQMTQLSGELTGRARSAYNAYEGAVDDFMAKLPGFEAGAAGATAGGREALDYARTAAGEAFSPLKGRALFQEAAQRALSAARPGMAARGTMQTGASGAAENQILQDLAFNALQGEQAGQQAAIQGLGGAAGNLSNLVGQQAGIAGLGPQAAGNLFQAQPQLAQLLSTATGMPMEAANSVLQTLTATQNPLFSLLRMVLPQVAQQSESFNFGLLSSDARMKRQVEDYSTGLDAVRRLRPVSFQYNGELGSTDDGTTHTGFIAQEVEPVIPECVGERDHDGTAVKTLDQSRMVPVLVNAVKELAARVEALEGKG
jgi:hypothetical protein